MNKIDNPLNRSLLHRSMLLCGVAMGALVGAAVISGPAMAQSAGQAVDQNGNVIQLQQVEVEGAGETATGPVDGFVARLTQAGSKTETPLIEIPQSVSVITRDQMEVRGVQNISQALDYSVGVVGHTLGTDPRFDSPLIRGFSASQSMYLNGLKFMRDFGAVAFEPYGLERIDVLLGPASVLYGQGNPGGLIDLVSKRATFTNFAEVRGEIGSFDRYVGAFDIGGLLSPEFSYRLTGLARSSGTQTDDVDDNRLFLAPTFTWRPNDQTSFTVLASIQYDEAGTPVGLPVEYTVKPFRNMLPRSMFLGDTNYDSSRRTMGTIGYEFSHKLNDNWEVRQNTQYMKLNWDYKNIYYSSLAAGNPTQVARGTSPNYENQDTISIDNQLEGKFDTGPLSHTLLVGLDYRYFKQMRTVEFGTAPNISLLFPNNNMPINHQPWYMSHLSGDMSQLGLYVQDQVKFDKWVLTAGLRQDWASVDTTNVTNYGVTEQDQDDDALTGRLGLTYLFDNGIAPYVSYSTSFEPVVGTMPVVLGGAPFQPSKGEQWEAGVKYQPMGWKGFLTAAVYDLRQKNVLTNQLIGGVDYQTQMGEVRVRGLELAATASLAEGLDLLANYTYMNAEIMEGQYAGNRPGGVPQNMANLWLNYTFQNGPLTGFALGGGMRYMGSRYTLDNNNLFLGANTLFDAMVSYEKGPFKAQLNVNNIADETYVSGCGSFGCYYGDGRSAIVQVTYKW